MKDPLVTVYVVSHNYGRFLEGAVESVLRQTLKDWELLVIDDQSTDQTREVMKLYQGDHRIQLIHTEGIGLPAVCNLAHRTARGKYLIRLDADDLFDENILLVLGNWMERNPDHAMVFPDHYFIDEEGEIFAQERRMKVFDQNHVLDIPANGACCMIRRDTLEALGGYREDLGAQDGFDLWSKLTAANHKCGNVNLPLFYYRRHDRNLTDQTKRILFARQSIKRDIVGSRLNKYRPVVAVIPCRRNYDFAPDLWSLPFRGKTLLEQAVEKTLKSDLFDHVVVTCDNPDARRSLLAFNDPRLIFQLRPMEDTLRSRPIALTLEKIMNHLGAPDESMAVLVYVQAPLVSTQTLEEAVFTLIQNDADSSVGMEEVDDAFFRRDANGLRPINPPRGLLLDFDRIYRETNTSLATRTRILRRGSLTGPFMVHYLVSSEECIFINSDHKYKVASVV
jgi:glycosyltransferase involved in cell wall biosynthesis